MTYTHSCHRTADELPQARLFHTLVARATLKELFWYSVVGGGEYVSGLTLLTFLLAHHFSFMAAFTIQQMVIGFSAFWVRKMWVFGKG